MPPYAIYLREIEGGGGEREKELLQRTFLKIGNTTVKLRERT
jgi:hypothetical protein